MALEDLKPDSKVQLLHGEVGIRLGEHACGMSNRIKAYIFEEP